MLFALLVGRWCLSKQFTLALELGDPTFMYLYLAR